MKIQKASIEAKSEIIDLIFELNDELNLKIARKDIQIMLTKYFNSKDIAILLALENSKVIGLLSIQFRPSLFQGKYSALIEEIIVKKEFRKMGIGSSLIDSARKLAVQRGCSELEVSTEKSNKKAINFYKKNGFDDEGVLLEQEF